MMINITNSSNDDTCLSSISNLDASFLRTELNVAGAAGTAAIYAVVFAIGIIGSCVRRRQRKGKEEGHVKEVVLASRSMNEVIGVLTLTATWVGGDLIVGTSEFLINPDLRLIWCQPPIYISMALVFNGLVYAKKMWNAGYITVLDPFQDRFGHVMTVLLYLVNVFAEIAFATISLTVLGATLNVIVGLSYLWAVVISAAISLIYTLLGGLASVAYTDVLQLFTMFFGLWLAVPFAYLNDAVSPLSQTAYGPDGWMGELLEGAWISHYLDNVLLLAIGAGPWQMYFQRALSQKTAEKAVRLSVIAGFVSLTTIAAPIVVGAIAASTDWNMTDYANVAAVPMQPCDYPLAMPLVMRFLTPLPVGVLALGAISASAMSSTDSVMLSLGTMFAHNMYQPFRNFISGRRKHKTTASEHEIVWVLRACMVVIAALTTYLALSVRSIVALISLAVDLTYCITFPQLVCVLHVPWANSYGSLIGYFVGAFLRFTGGEPYLGIEAYFKYPWYDEETGIQRFPYKTFLVILHFIALLGISWITHKAAQHWQWVRTVDKYLFQSFVEKPKEPTIGDYLPKEDSVSNPDLKEPRKRNEDLSTESNGTTSHQYNGLSTEKAGKQPGELRIHEETRL